MKKSTIVTIILIAAAVVLGVIFISWYLRKATPLYIQGTVECTTYKASSKVPGRIEEMKVEEGQHVTKGELLYTLSTPELNAKLQQAEAVKSAASAMDQKALTGARIQQKEAALNLWEKAQAGLLLAQKTFDRVNNLYEQGVVPAQKLDEARANLQAMQATERAAKAQCELVFDGASKEEKEAAAAQVRQAEGAVSEVESYLSDALVYAPVTGEVSTIIAEAGELVGTGYPRSGDSRYERRMGDLQHQGGSDARHPYRNPYDRLYPGLGPQRGVRGDLYRCAGRFRHLVRNTHAGRLRHPHLCRQSQTHARRGIHPAGYERTGELERHRQIIQKG